MNKIKKFLKEQGYQIEFIDKHTLKGKKSFFGDGVYTEDVYKVSNNQEEYKLTNKVTGRKYYMMCRTCSDSLVCGGVSQGEFIEMFKAYLSNKKMDVSM